MRLESFHHLALVAEAGSFYAAAEEAFISQQGLNKSVTALENELGMQLLVRDRSGVRLTPAGEVVLKHERLLRDGYRNMLEELASLNLRQGEADARLTVHTTYYPMQLVAGMESQIQALKKYNVIEEPFKKLIEDARASDGTELYVVDASMKTMQELKSYPDLVFKPLFITRFGVIWKNSTVLEGQEVVHRQTVQQLPMGINASRDMAKLTNWIFRDSPLENVRYAASYPKMLLEFVAATDENVAVFDSFGVYLAGKDSGMSTEGVNYTPLSTPEGVFQVGFLFNKKMKPKSQVMHVVERITAFMHENFSDYFEKYPVK